MSEYINVDEFPMQRVFAYLSTNLKVRTALEPGDEPNTFKAVTRLYLIEPKTGDEKLIAEG